MDLLALSTALVAIFAFISLGGGIFEHAVIDRAWPNNPAIIQPAQGGVKRVWFWLPVHVAFELCLVVALFIGWGASDVRQALLIALISHAAMRIWSAFDHIPKALAFERAAPGAIDADEARAWTRRSLGRFPLALITSLASLAAFGAACAARM